MGMVNMSNKRKTAVGKASPNRHTIVGAGRPSVGGTSRPSILNSIEALGAMGAMAGQRKTLVTSKKGSSQEGRSSVYKRSSVLYGSQPAPAKSGTSSTGLKSFKKMSVMEEEGEEEEEDDIVPSLGAFKGHVNFGEDKSKKNK